MVKVRVIPQLLVADGLMKKPVRFTQRPRNIGNPIAIARVFESRQVDELILLDIGGTSRSKAINPAVVAQIAEELTVPLAVGGGVRDLETVIRLIGAGAEKIVLNSGAMADPALIDQAARRYGAQCVVVSIDAKRGDDGALEVFTHNGSRPTGREPVAWAREVVARGAGEILVNAIDRDGTMEGYDVPLIRAMADAVDVPVVAAGGCGSAEDCVRAVLDGHASAVVVGSLFHFRRVTPDMIKQAMAEHGIPVRLARP